MNNRPSLAPYMNYKKRFALELHIARSHKHMSQRVLAMEIGTTQSEVCNWERANIFPNLFTILALQRILNADFLTNIVAAYDQKMEEEEKNKAEHGVKRDFVILKR
ncbi:helix-turn-helix domain-containing protein [Amygdalobacter nucleatus]|nr:helix-turn-helix transcriptional regulator [Amygdalobacter nucleatus]MDF0485602.1 helix-turn-helix transcriptional regulator [Amygdalobacter nucleatus]